MWLICVWQLAGWSLQLAGRNNLHNHARTKLKAYNCYLYHSELQVVHIMIKCIYIVTSHVICRIDERISHVLNSLSEGEHLTTPDLNICNASGRSITLIHKIKPEWHSRLLEMGGMVWYRFTMLILRINSACYHPPLQITAGRLRVIEA